MQIQGTLSPPVTNACNTWGKIPFAFWVHFQMWAQFGTPLSDRYQNRILIFYHIWEPLIWGPHQLTTIIFITIKQLYITTHGYSPKVGPLSLRPMHCRIVVYGSLATATGHTLFANSSTWHWLSVQALYTSGSNHIHPLDGLSRNVYWAQHPIWQRPITQTMQMTASTH